MFILHVHNTCSYCMFFCNEYCWSSFPLYSELWGCHLLTSCFTLRPLQPFTILLSASSFTENVNLLLISWRKISNLTWMSGSCLWLLSCTVHNTEEAVCLSGALLCRPPPPLCTYTQQHTVIVRNQENKLLQYFYLHITDI